LPNKDYGTLHTIKTYSDFIKTLSEGERESFLEFGKKKAAELKNPPVQLPLKWIETHFEELQSQWQQQNSTNASTHWVLPNSTKVPNRESWDASTHEGVSQKIDTSRQCAFKGSRKTRCAFIRSLSWGIEERVHLYALSLSVRKDRAQGNTTH
jgi:hypothetical protein